MPVRSQQKCFYTHGLLCCVTPVAVVLCCMQLAPCNRLHVEGEGPLMKGPHNGESINSRTCGNSGGLKATSDQDGRDPAGDWRG